MRGSRGKLSPPDLRNSLLEMSALPVELPPPRQGFPGSSRHHLDRLGQHKKYLYSKFVKQIPYIDFAFAEPYITVYNELVQGPEN